MPAEGPTARLTRDERVHAATEMALYISIVLLATLSALPDDFDSGGREGPPLLAVLWGTTLGLTLAHWFAFQLASAQLHGVRLPRRDLERLAMQVTGAAAVMLATSVPVLLAAPDDRVEAATFMPAALIGLAGYGVARSAGTTRVRSVLTGMTVLLLGFAVALVKALLAGH